MSDAIRQMFDVLVPSVQPRKLYISLYCRTPFFGGPEEGGWWGHDVTLERKSVETYTRAEAEELAAQVREEAEELSRIAKRSFGEACRQSLDWLEARGMEPSDMPEVDGEQSYFVVIEEKPGSHEQRGDRTWS